MARFTRQAIINEFAALISERPLDKITVTDLVKACGINRNTFYYYFHDIYALAGAVVAQGLSTALASEEPLDELRTVLPRLMEYARKNRRLILHIYNAEHRILEQQLYNCIYAHVLAYVQAEAADIPAGMRDITQLSTFCTYAVTGSFLAWLNNGMRDTAGTHLYADTRMLDDSIRTILLHRTKQAARAEAG